MDVGEGRRVLLLCPSPGSWGRSRFGGPEGGWTNAVGPVQELYPFRELHPYPEIERHGYVCFPSRMNRTDFEEAGKPHVNL